MPEDESPLESLVESYQQRPDRTLLKPIIFADSRESQSDVINELNNFDCIVKQKVLAVGDYLLSDRICVERKTAPDFVSSIMDGRLFSQIKSLKDNFDKPILLVEGNNLYANVKPNIIRGALAAIAIDFSLPLIWTKDAAETAGIIHWIARREQLDEKREVPIRNDKKAESNKQKQEFLVAGLPGISVVRARALLKKFKSPMTVFNASEEELAQVENVGPKTAKKIREMLEENYK